MLRKNSIVKFVFLGIIALLGILLCVCPFNVPSTTNKYQGFYNSIEKGIDIGGGVSAEYVCSLPTASNNDISNKIDASLSRLNNIFSKENYSQLFITRQGDNKIRIEAGGSARDTDNCFWYLEDAKKFFMTFEKASETLAPKVLLDSSHIKYINVNYDYTTQAYGFNIEFTSQGLESLKELKEFSNKTTDKKVYIYLEEVSSSHLLNEYNANDVENKMFITANSNGSYSTSAYTDAKELSYNIMGGTIGLDIELQGVNYIAPKLGSNPQLLIGIAFLITIAIAFIWLLVRYRDLGMLGVLSLIFFIVLDLFLIQSIPLITLDIAGVVAIFLGFILALFSQVLIFEKIREEYALGKKIHLSCKGGFKKALWPILDSHFILMLALIFVWVFAPTTLKCFAIILLVASVLSIFCSLALTRYFVHIYLPINSTKAKKLNLKRAEGVKEIKEVETLVSSEIGGDDNE